MQVDDTSGGCGDFFRVTVVSKKFEGVSLVMQHRMVNELLKKQFDEIHGLTLKTIPLSKYKPE